jgi:hypothetical protein
MPAKGQESMDQSRAIPMIGPDVQEMPPRALRQRLRADEQLLWWSSGRGSTFDRGSWAVVVVALGFLLLVSAIVRDNAALSRDFLVFAMVILGALAILRAIVGARFEVYGLTGERVIFIPGPPSPLRYSVGRDGGSAGAIHMLEVTGSRKRGSIRLQAAFGAHSMLKVRPVRLTGIERPLEVAKLIQSTLDLPVPIEDRTR